MLAELVVRVAETVPGGGLGVAVAQLLVHGQGLLAGGEGLAVVAELGVAPADCVEGIGLAGPVTGGPVQVERPLRVPERGQVVPPPGTHKPEVQVGQRLAGAVAQLDAQVEAAREVRLGFPVAAELSEHAGQPAMRVDPGRPVIQPYGGLKGDRLHGRPLVPAALPVEVVPERPGQLPGVGVEAIAGRTGDGREQHRQADRLHVRPRGQRERAPRVPLGVSADP